MTIYEKPVRLLFWDMVDDVGLQKGQVLTKQQGIDWFRKNFPKIKASTVSAHFIQLSTNARTHVHYNAKAEDDLFFQIDGSHFRRYEPGVDPPPIYGPIAGRLKDDEADKELATVASNKYRWSSLNKLQIGRYAEYYVMMEFTLYGFEVYSSALDDRRIDFVGRDAVDPFYEVKVKSVRDENMSSYQKVNLSYEIISWRFL